MRCLVVCALALCAQGTAASYVLGTNVTAFLEALRASGSVPLPSAHELASDAGAHHPITGVADGGVMGLNTSRSSNRRALLARESIKQEVDHKAILALKPSETAAKDLDAHVNAAAEVNMWAPLWPEAHRPGEHAVFGLALNYDVRHFYW